MMSVSVAGIPKNRCRTTVAEPIGGRLAELSFTGARSVCLLADAESAAHAPTKAYPLFFAAWLGLVRCNAEAVATHSQVLADIVSRYDLPALWAGRAAFLQGWAKWSGGAEGSGLAEMRRGIAICRESGSIYFLPSFEAALAEAEASASETDAGLRRLDDALVELEATEGRWYEAEIHRIRAEILLKRDSANTVAAEQSLQAAIAIAQSQKGAQLRTARRAVSGKALSLGQSRRRCARRCGAGGRGLPANPTIPRTH
jgi:adenylate cyclase